MSIVFNNRSISTRAMLLRLGFIFSLPFLLTACHTLDSTEYGVRFWNVPPQLGGGVSNRVIKPGETYLHIPLLTEFYVYDTSVKSIRWETSLDGKMSSESSEPHQDSSARGRRSYLQTRAADGNEVALAMTVSYRFLPEPEMLPSLVAKVGKDDRHVYSLVLTAAQSDIRSYMNRIRTAEFISNSARYSAVDAVAEALRKRLAPFGIEIVRVNLDDFKFWRELPDGSLDTSYEDILKLIQQRQEDIRREEARYETLKQEKERELTEAQAKKASLLEEASGYREQMTQKGEGYLRVKENEAESALKSGQLKAEAIQAAVSALEGSGGEALLRLRLAEEFLKANPQFVLVQSSGSQKISVEKSDINELLGQIGLIEGLARERQVQNADRNEKISEQPEKSVE